jgi:3-oxoacyl-[acyl-carrier-protein] synthase-3
MLTKIDDVGVRRIINIEGDDEREVSSFFEDSKHAARVQAVTGIAKVRYFSEPSLFQPFIELGERYRALCQNIQDVVAVVVVSQTRDYLFPNMSICLARELGCSTDTVCIDLPFGCSGFGNGLFQAMLMAQNLRGNVLIFLGDKLEPFLGDDLTLRPVFGEAASLVEVAVQVGASALFDIYTDGSGAESIKMTGSIFDPQATHKLHMDGTSVLSFAMAQVPASVQRLVDHFKLTSRDFDGVYLHQANKFVVEKVKGRLPDVIARSAVHNVPGNGNTGPASIPIAMLHLNGAGLLEGNLLTVGFGVGWSVCSAYLKHACIELS